MRIKQRKGGFTLIELLVVISIIAVLMAVMMPALQKAREQAKKSSCANSIHQCVLGLNIYATENASKLPRLDNAGGGWLWDVPVSATDTIIKSGGSRDTFYCPAYPEANTDERWGINSTTYRITGYFWMLQLVSENPTTHQPVTPRPEIAGSGHKQWITTTACKNPSAAELVTDATLSQGINPAAYPNGKFINIVNTLTSRSNHLERGKDNRAAGGNMGFVDGHVSWRDFDNMEPRAGYTRLPLASSNQIAFWW